MQRAIAERNAGAPAEKRIEFRIGVDLGDIIRDGRDIYGDGVNVAARLEALAEPGGICVKNSSFIYKGQAAILAAEMGAARLVVLRVMD